MTATDMANQYCKVSLAAQELRVDPSFVYRAIARGTLTGICVGGWAVERSSLERLKAEREKQQQAV